MVIFKDFENINFVTIDIECIVFNNIIIRVTITQRKQEIAYTRLLNCSKSIQFIIQISDKLETCLQNGHFDCRVKLKI